MRLRMLAFLYDTIDCRNTVKCLLKVQVSSETYNQSKYAFRSSIETFHQSKHYFHMDIDTFNQSKHALLSTVLSLILEELFWLY